MASALKGVSSLLGRAEEMAGPDVPEPPPTFLRERLMKRKREKEERKEVARKTMGGLQAGPVRVDQIRAVGCQKVVPLAHEGGWLQAG